MITYSLAAVLMLMPRAYVYNPHSPDAAREAYVRIVGAKDTRLKIALWLFVASIVALLVALFGVSLLSVPFFLAGGLKIVYDLLLYRSFRATKPPEEKAKAED